MVSESTGAMTTEPVTFLASGSVMEDLIVHFLPSCVHDPSPKPPASSKLHERTFLAIGSQPIQTFMLPSEKCLSVVAKVPVMKFWLSAQTRDKRSTSPLPFSPAQSPMAHSRPRKLP